MTAQIRIEDYRLYRTQGEWDADPHSTHYHRHVWREGTYQPRAYSEPERFPCIAIRTDFGYNPDGADFQHFAFFYDFELVE